MEKWWEDSEKKQKQGRKQWGEKVLKGKIKGGECVYLGGNKPKR